MAEADRTPSAETTSSMPAFARNVLTIGLMVAVLLQVLDSTIANVALPHMQASLEATQESVNWVLTSYVVASAIALPTSGWLSDWVGRKRLLLTSVAVFTGASVLCASAHLLTEMVVFRVAQGISGAFILPLAQSTLFDINPREKHGQAMALFSGGVTIGPILGPVIGGWLTDNYNWRWVFLVNLPLGVICALILLRYMPRSQTRKLKFDLLGFCFLAVALASLQMFLDRGQQQDWFESWEIIIEAGLAISAAWMFVVHTVTAKEPLFERSMFADRNFTVGLVFMSLTGVFLLAGIALLPPLLQTIYGYSVLQSGYLLAPRGVGALFSMVIAGFLTGKVDARVLVALGVTLMTTSLWIMTGFALDQPAEPIIISGIVQGLGLGLIFVPLQSLAFETLAPKMRTTAAALINLGRNVGGSIGISIVGAQLVRMTQVAHADIASAITEQTIPTADPTLLQTIAPQGSAALAALNAEATRQALFIAYLDDFHLMMLMSIAAFPLLLLMRPASGRGRTQMAMD